MNFAPIAAGTVIAAAMAFLPPQPRAHADEGPLCSQKERWEQLKPGDRIHVTCDDGTHYLEYPIFNHGQAVGRAVTLQDALRESRI